MLVRKTMIPETPLNGLAYVFAMSPLRPNDALRSLIHHAVIGDQPWFMDHSYMGVKILTGRN